MNIAGMTRPSTHPATRETRRTSNDIKGAGLTGTSAVAVITFIALPWVFASDAALTTMCLIWVMIVLALSYNMLFGQTGLLSFGHAVYYGLGGFFAVHAMNIVIHRKYPVPLAAIPIVGGLAGLATAAVFGSFSTRRAGTAFAMISLGIGELVVAAASILQDFFGGESGITTNRARLLPLFGLRFGSQAQTYYLIGAWSLLCILLMYGVTRTPFGRACNAVRENAERAEFVGYDARKVRYIAFCLSGCFAGVAGALAAINFELVGVSSLTGAQSGMILLMTYIGGTGLFAGPIVGAALVTYLQVTLSDVTDGWLMYLGLFFMLVVVFRPNGITGFLSMHIAALRQRQGLQLLPAYLLISGPICLVLAGATSLIELFYHGLGVSRGTVINILDMPLDSATPIPWAIAAAMLGFGIWMTRRYWPRVTQAWSLLDTEDQ